MPPAALSETFATLREILAAQSKRLLVTVDKPGDFQVASPTLRDRVGRPLFVAAVKTRKNYVSYHLMGVYVQPELQKALSPALKKRMQGKSCFSFTVIDPGDRKRLAAVTRASVEACRDLKLPWAKPARPTAAAAASDTARQVDSFIDRYEPPIQKLVRQARTKLRRRMPTAVELVYNGYNALAIAYAASERKSDAIVSLAVYARGVNLYFLYGIGLPDPHRLLQGGGNQGRFVRLDSAAMLDRPEIDQLLAAAIDDLDTPLPQTGRGYTVIKSVSPKLRPPAAGVNGSRVRASARSGRRADRNPS